MLRIPVFVCLTGLPFLLSGCASWAPEPAPGLETTEFSTLNWSEYVEAANVDMDAGRNAFWRHTDDTVLSGLIEAVNTQNVDLAAVRLRVAEARAMADAEIASLGPSANVGGSGAYNRTSLHGALPVGNFPGFDPDRLLYEVNFDAGWELDYYGRTDTQFALNVARIAQAMEMVTDARFSLEAELVRAYVDYQAAGRELAALDVILDRQSKLLAAIETRRDHGEASDYDVQRVETQLSEYRTHKAPLETRQAVAKYQIAVLVGQQPNTLQLSDDGDLPDFTEDHVDLSSDVLRQRSDVRQAELDYLIAAKQLQLREIDLLPSFQLFARGGPSTADITELLNPESLALNVGALVSWRLFDGGRRKNLVDAAQARLSQTELGYRAVVLSAMQDIETSAVRLAKLRESLARREDVTASRDVLVDMAQARFDGGTGTLLQVLEAERDAADALMAETELRADVLNAQIAFEKSLGAGFPVVSIGE
ncbi:TolC family protein [Ponticaulis profundi]|uniref:TolC family protein n=1 Tax=Ponticaulis profundi TaxID=2665222 RepID=A0ABW1S498_9PROT